MQRTRRRLQLSEVSPHLKCVLCGGFFIDATTIVECLHSFCRSCLIKYLRNNSFCPICDVQIHKTKPFLNIKPDKTLQDIVYKLVPGLFHIEMHRRRIFYSKHPEQLSLTRPEERGVGVERIIYSADDSFSLSLEYYDAERAGEEWRSDSSRSSESGINDAAPASENASSKRYLQCPALVTVAILKKFITLKYDLKPHHKVDVIYRRESLADDYTLMDVAYIYTWKRSGPMRFFYHIIDTKLEPMVVAKDSLATHAVQDKSTQNGVTSSGIQEERTGGQATQVEIKKEPAQPQTQPTSTVISDEHTLNATPKSTEAALKSVTAAPETQNSSVAPSKKCPVPQPPKAVAPPPQPSKQTDTKVEVTSTPALREVKAVNSIDPDPKTGGGNESDTVKSAATRSSDETKTVPNTQNTNSPRVTKNNELAKELLARQEENSAKLNTAIAVLSNGFVAPKTEAKVDVSTVNTKMDVDACQGPKSDVVKNTVNNVATVNSSKVVPTGNGVKVAPEASDGAKIGPTSNAKRQELKGIGNKDSTDNSSSSISGRSKLVPTNKMVNDVQSVKPPIENPNQQILTKNDEIIATPNILKRQQCFNESLKRKMQNNETGKSYLNMNRLNNEANKALMKKVRLLKQESSLNSNAAPLKRPHEVIKAETEPNIKKTRVEESLPSALHKVRITKTKTEHAVNGERPITNVVSEGVDKSILQNNKTIEKVKKSLKMELVTKKDEPVVGATQLSVLDIKSEINSKSVTQNVTSESALNKADIKKSFPEITRNSVEPKCKSVDTNQKQLGSKVKHELPDKTVSNSRPPAMTQTLNSGIKKTDGKHVNASLPHLIEIPKVSEKKVKSNPKSVGQPSQQNNKQEINKDVRPSPKHDRIGALDLTSSRSQPHPLKRHPSVAPAPPLSPLSPLSAFPLMSLPLRSPPPQLKIPNVSRLPHQRPSSLSSSSPSPPADSRSPRMSSGTSPTQPDFRARLSASPQSDLRRGSVTSSRGPKTTPTSPASEAKSNRLLSDDLNASRMGPPPEMASTTMRQQLEMHARLWGAVAMNPDYFQSQQQQLKQMEALALMRSLGRGSVPPNSTCNRKT